MKITDNNSQQEHNDDEDTEELYDEFEIMKMVAHFTLTGKPGYDYYLYKANQDGTIDSFKRHN